MLISNFFPDDDNEDAFKEDINSDIDFPLYEEIHGIDMKSKVMEPFPILRPECQILKADDDSMIPRPKLGWRNRKVTFGKFWVKLLYA